eukprot:SAG31_NODE_8346_length_1469_cov_1.201460_1_plen_222_part_10
MPTSTVHCGCTSVSVVRVKLLCPQAQMHCTSTVRLRRPPPAAFRRKASPAHGFRPSMELDESGEQKVGVSAGLPGSADLPWAQGMPNGSQLSATSKLAMEAAARLAADPRVAEANRGVVEAIGAARPLLSCCRPAVETIPFFAEAGASRQAICSAHRSLQTHRKYLQSVEPWSLSQSALRSAPLTDLCAAVVTCALCATQARRASFYTPDRRCRAVRTAHSL